MEAKINLDMGEAFITIPPLIGVASMVEHQAIPKAFEVVR